MKIKDREARRKKKKKKSYTITRNLNLLKLGCFFHNGYKNCFSRRKKNFPLRIRDGVSLLIAALNKLESLLTTASVGTSRRNGVATSDEINLRTKTAVISLFHRVVPCTRWLFFSKTISPAKGKKKLDKATRRKNTHLLQLLN